MSLPGCSPTHLPLPPCVFHLVSLPATSFGSESQMNSNRRRGSARSASEPPPPGPWASLGQLEPSASPDVIDNAADPQPSRPTLHIDTQPPPPGSQRQHRGRGLKRDSASNTIPPVSIERHVPPPVEAGLDPITMTGKHPFRSHTSHSFRKFIFAYFVNHHIHFVCYSAHEE